MFIRRSKYDDLQKELKDREERIERLLLSITDLVSGDITPEEFMNLTQGLTASVGRDPHNHEFRAYFYWLRKQS